MNTPTSGDDILYTVSAGETINGLAGNDFISATHNLARLFGDFGEDTLLTSLAVIGTTSGILPIETFQSGGDGDDLLTASLRYDNAPGVGPDVDPRLLAELSGGAGDDRLALTIASNWGDIRAELSGGAGDDRIEANLVSVDEDGLEPAPMTLTASGGAGEDVLRLNIDNYPLIGVAHQAVLHATGGSGDDDMVVFVRSGGVNTAAADVVLDGGSGADTIAATTFLGSEGGATGRVLLTGGSGADQLTSDMTAYGARIDAVNRIEGGDGDDVLDGRIALFNPADYSDFSRSGVAEVRLYGGAGDDHLSGEILYLLQTGSSRNLLFGGSGDDLVEVAGGHDNRLEGGSGADELRGGDGVDILVGGAGRDILSGAAGADRFIFAAVSDSTRSARDTIQDFTTGDRINVARIDAGAATGDQAFAWGGGSHTGRGYLWVADQGEDAVVIAETEAGNRLVIRVADGADHHWSLSDFIL
jgi:Ca2+-binding RTX toxin-like protein